MKYKHISEEKLIDLALGNVSNEEKQKMSIHIRHCQTCQNHLEFWEQTFQRESNEAPHSEVKERLWQEIKRERQPKPVVRKPRKPALVIAISSAVAIFMVAIGLIYYNQSLERSYQVVHNDDIYSNSIHANDQTKQVAVVPISDYKDVSGNLWINNATQEMLLEVDGLPTFSDHDYQLWIVYEDDQMEGEILSIQNGASRVFFKGRDINQFKLLKASVEPVGGSSSPTGPETFFVPLDYSN